MDSDILVTFITKDSQYSIPSHPLTIQGSTTTDQLELIIKSLLVENVDKSDAKAESLDLVEFDFLIDGKLLRTTLQDFLVAEQRTNETQLEIEYFLKSLPPQPHKSFLHDDWVASVCVQGDWILSGCYDNSVHVWDGSSGKHRISIPAHGSSVKAVKWTGEAANDHEYRFVSCSHDETAMLWTWDSKKNDVEHLATFIGHSRSVDCVDVYGELVATGSYDHMLKIWSLQDASRPAEQSSEEQQTTKSNSKLRSPVITLEGHKESISGCTWLTDSTTPAVATASMDNTIKIWDVELAEPSTVLTSNKPFLGIDYSPANGLMLTASADRHIRLWDHRIKEGGQVKQVYTSHDGWVSSVCWGQDGQRFVSSSYDNRVKQWDLRSPNAPLYELLGHQDKVLCVDWSNSGQIIASGGADNQIKVFREGGK